MRNTELSSLDISQIQRRTYEESKDATRVYLVGGGVSIDPQDVKSALQEGFKDLRLPAPEVKIPEQKHVEIKEIQVPVIVKETEIKEIQVPVIVKEFEIKEVQVPVVVKETILKTIEVPVIVKEVSVKEIEVVRNVELTISKPILYCVILQTLITLGLLVHNILK